MSFSNCLIWLHIAIPLVIIFGLQMITPRRLITFFRKKKRKSCYIPTYSTSATRFANIHCMKLIPKWASEALYGTTVLRCCQLHFFQFPSRTTKWMSTCTTTQQSNHQINTYMAWKQLYSEFFSTPVQNHQPSGHMYTGMLRRIVSGARTRKLWNTPYQITTYLKHSHSWSRP